MTDKQRADLEAGQRGVTFNNENNTALGTITDDTLPPILAGIVTQVKAIEIAESAQQSDGGDVSNKKKLLKAEMAKVVVKYALRGEVKANALKMTDLASSLEHPVTYITDADDVLSVTRATDMKDIMDVNKGPSGVLINIVAGDITIMSNAIQAFKDIANKPTEIVKEKKAEGTDKLQPEVDKLNGFIDAEKKLLHSYWDDTDNKALADKFDLVTHPVVLGKRHNSVEITMVKDENGEKLTGGLVTCTKNNKTSDGNGSNVYTIEEIQAGVQPFKAEADGRVTQNFDVTVIRRKTVEVTVRMKLIS